MKIIYMGTPQFAVPSLQKILTNPQHEVLCVYTSAPKPAARGLKIFKSAIHQAAEEKGLKIHTPLTLKTDEEKEFFKSFNADVAVVAAYGMLLPKDILTGTKFGCINIHPSLLPRWRGAAPLQRTLIEGDKKTACCIMQMEEGLDTGAVLHKKEFELDEKINLGELHDLMAETGAHLLEETLDDLENYLKNAEPQNNNLACYAKKITKNDELIDFNNPTLKIHNQIRGLSPYPSAYFMYEGLKYKILKSEYKLNENLNFQNGSIINNEMHIKASDGVIIPKIIQKEGKKPMEIKEFLNGNKIL